jgi:hypothetical protein
LDLHTDNNVYNCGFILGVQVHHNSSNGEVSEQASKSVCRVRSLLPFFTAFTANTKLLRPPATDMGSVIAFSMVFFISFT